MHHCMNKSELNAFITFKTNGEPVNSRDLELRIESSHNWQVELGFLNYLFAQVLERKKREHLDCLEYIICLYELEERMYIRIHELDYRFIDYMTLFLRQDNLSLEDELVHLHINMCEFIYE